MSLVTLTKRLDNIRVAWDRVSVLGAKAWVSFGITVELFEL